LKRCKAKKTNKFAPNLPDYFAMFFKRTRTPTSAATKAFIGTALTTASVPHPMRISFAMQAKRRAKAGSSGKERAAHPNLSIAFLLEVWSETNNLAERSRKLQQYQTLGATEFFELDSQTGDFSGQRLINGQYNVLEPNADGRLQSLSLNAELAFDDGLLRLYRDGRRILTLSEAQAELATALAEVERLKKELGRSSSS